MTQFKIQGSKKALLSVTWLQKIALGMTIKRLGGGDPSVFKVRLCFESNADLLSEEMGDLSASMVICIAGVCFPKFESRACAKSVVPTGEDEGRGCDS